jgi:hypothetical protein
LQQPSVEDVLDSYYTDTDTDTVADTDDGIFDGYSIDTDTDTDAVSIADTVIVDRNGTNNDDSRTETTADKPDSSDFAFRLNESDSGFFSIKK